MEEEGPCCCVLCTKQNYAKTPELGVFFSVCLFASFLVLNGNWINSLPTDWVISRVARAVNLRRSDTSELGGEFEPENREEEEEEVNNKCVHATVQPLLLLNFMSKVNKVVWGKEHGGPVGTCGRTDLAHSVRLLGHTHTQFMYFKGNHHHEPHRQYSTMSGPCLAGHLHVLAPALTKQTHAAHAHMHTLIHISPHMTIHVWSGSALLSVGWGRLPCQDNLLGSPPSLS